MTMTLVAHVMAMADILLLILFWMMLGDADTGHRTVVVIIL